MEPHVHHDGVEGRAEELVLLDEVAGVIHVGGPSGVDAALRDARVGHVNERVRHVSLELHDEAEVGLRGGLAVVPDMGGPRVFAGMRETKTSYLGAKEEEGNKEE